MGEEMSTAEREAMERAWQETRRFSSTSADLVEYRKGWRAGRAYSEQERQTWVEAAHALGLRGAENYLRAERAEQELQVLKAALVECQAYATELASEGVGRAQAIVLACREALSRSTRETSE